MTNIAKTSRQLTTEEHRAALKAKGQNDKPQVFTTILGKTYYGVPLECRLNGKTYPPLLEIGQVMT